MGKKLKNKTWLGTTQAPPKTTETPTTFQIKMTAQPTTEETALLTNLTYENTYLGSFGVVHAQPDVLAAEVHVERGAVVAFEDERPAGLPQEAVAHGRPDRVPERLQVDAGPLSWMY